MARIGGIGFVVLAVACFGALDTSSKVAAAAVPVLMALWVRYGIQTVVTTTMLWPRERAALFRTQRPWLQGLRALLLVTCNALAFLSLAHMHVGEFTAVVMLTPLVLTVMAAVTFGERVSPLGWVCLLAGFAGVLMVVRPDDDLFHAAMLLPLLLVACNTGYQMLTSALTKLDAPGTIHFYSGLVGWLLTTLALPLVWKAQPASMWAVMVLMGALGAAGHYLLILAYMRTPVTVLTPYLYLQIFFGALGGWLVFEHVPDGWTMAGIGVIFAAGVVGTWATGREMLRGSYRDSAESSVAVMTGVDVR